MVPANFGYGASTLKCASSPDVFPCRHWSLVKPYGHREGVSKFGALPRSLERGVRRHSPYVAVPNLIVLVNGKSLRTEIRLIFGPLTSRLSTSLKIIETDTDRSGTL